MVAQRYCASASPETSDGSSPIRGAAYMSCGSEFDKVLQGSIASCERAENSRCMSVFYFDRERHTEIQSFEAENMERIAKEVRKEELKRQAQERIRITKVCLSYGFKPKTSELANCVMQQTQHEAELKVQKQNRAQQQRLENAARDASFEAELLRNQRFLDCLNKNNPSEICN